jgi:hypothetical protein
MYAKSLLIGVSSLISVHERNQYTSLGPTVVRVWEELEYTHMRVSAE